MMPRAVLAISAALLLVNILVIPTTALKFDPESVGLDTRHEWCLSQISACSSLCKSQYYRNDCRDNDLDFTCDCEDYPTPDLLEFKNTLPSLACFNLYLGCINATELDDVKGRAKCWSDIGYACGTKDAEDFEPPMSTATAQTRSRTSSVAASSTPSKGSDQITGVASTFTRVAGTLIVPSTSGQTNDTSIISRTTSTLATSTSQTSTVTGASPVSKDDNAVPPTGRSHKGMSTRQILGIALGLAASALVIYIITSFIFARKRHARARDEFETATALRMRSPRYDRGFLSWFERTQAAAPGQPPNTGIRDMAMEKWRMSSDDVFGIPTSPAELPANFALARPRSRVGSPAELHADSPLTKPRSRIYEVE